MRYLLAVALLAVPAAALARGGDPVCSEPVPATLFISPMGEPFRPTPDGADPVRRWFDQADRDHDGKLTIGELMLDGDRFFAILDTDHNGELLPDEVDAYEEKVAPEVRLYQRRDFEGGNSDGRRRGPKGGRGGGRGGSGDRSPPDGSAGGDEPKAIGSYKPFGGDGATGAGRYAFLNIPNPVASADDDINRAVSHAEFRNAAAERFRALDPGQTKALRFAGLPKTPAQIAANKACIARVKASAGGKRTPAQ